MRAVLWGVLTLWIPFAIAGTEPWWDRAHNIVAAADTEQQPLLIKELQSDPSLPAKLKTALHGKEHFSDAVQVIVWLKMQDCWADLFTEAKTQPSWEAILALETLNSSRQHAEWRPWLAHLFEPKTWDKIESPTRVALMDTALQEHVELSSERFESLFQEDNQAVRLSSLRLLSQEIQSHPEDQSLRTMMHKAFRLPGVEMRMEAVWVVKDMPSRLQMAFKDSLGACAKSDERTEVKSACSDLLHSI